MHSILTPKLFIKEHEEMTCNGRFTSRLAALVESMMHGFSKLGYMTIRDTFLRNETVTDEFVIQQE